MKKKDMIKKAKKNKPAGLSVVPAGVVPSVQKRTMEIIEGLRGKK